MKKKITLNNNNRKIIIKLDESRITYTKENFYITIIEIKGNDGIKSQTFFEIDEQIFDDYKRYLEEDIYSLFFQKEI